MLFSLPLIASAQVAEGPTQTIIPRNVSEQTQEHIPKEVECSCIKIARNVGVNIPMGTDAKDLKPNTTPHIGALILLRYGDVYHVAVIRGYVGGFQVVEGNFKKGPCVATSRVVDFNDPHIVGFVDF